METQQSLGHDGRVLADIVLTTLNARYAHASLALRYLAANLGELRSRTTISEFVIQDRPADIAEAILAESPRIVGIGVYIWNAAASLQLVRILRRVAPDIVIVVGGPEVSHEVDVQPICALADYVVTGEGELAFRELATRIFAGTRPLTRVVAGGLPPLSELTEPYPLYDDRDVRDRVIYVEASRGCPFRCEFCLSSLDSKVRPFPLPRFLSAMDTLWQRGVRHFKFIDRTFNLKPSTSQAILEFFLARLEPGAFLHFEMIPDRLPAELRATLARFPPGSLQLEVGIQTFDPATAARISRRQDYAAVAENLAFLREHTHVHVHADLIAGLPGEDLASFGRGFDELVALAPQEIQVGILKRLRGTPITRHDLEWQMVYSEDPPYELLASGVLSFAELQRLKRFARAWDLVSNSGNFRDSVRLLWGEGSPFVEFAAFTDWLADQVGPFSGIALPRLNRLVFRYLVEEKCLRPRQVAPVLAADFVRPGRSVPAHLEAHLEAPVPAASAAPAGVPRRQARHLR